MCCWPWQGQSISGLTLLSRASQIQEIVEGEPCKLIEAVAERIADDVLETHSLVNEVRIRIQKPQVAVTGILDSLGVPPWCAQTLCLSSDGEHALQAADLPGLQVLRSRDIAKSDLDQTRALPSWCTSAIVMVLTLEDSAEPCSLQLSEEPLLQVHGGCVA